MQAAVALSQEGEEADPFRSMRSVKTVRHAYRVAAMHLVESRKWYAQAVARGVRNRNGYTHCLLYMMDELFEAEKWRQYGKSIMRSR